MPFRDVTLPDGSTVRARVSDDAITDWLATREAIRNQYGFDRPPDWDTGPQRGWLPHVNDPEDRKVFDHLTIGRRRVMDIAGDDPAARVAEGHLITWVWEQAAVISKLIVSWRGDGSFRVKWRAHTRRAIPELGAAAGKYLVDTEWIIGDKHDPAEVGTWLEQKLIEVDAVANVSARAGQPLTNEAQLIVPRITEGDEPLAAGKEAAADVVAEYGWAEWAEPFLGPKPAEDARVEA